MVKTNLPVMILKGLVLFPHNEIRIDFDNDHNVIDVSELFHDNYLLVVSELNPLEENPGLSDLPKIGVIARIKVKIPLPNGQTRVIISGVNRAHIHEYMNLKHKDEVVESIVSEVEKTRVDSALERTLTRKLYREVVTYVETVSYVSNSILGFLLDINSLAKMTDVVASYLSLDLRRKIEYIETLDPVARTKMLIEDINQEKELYEIDSNIDLELKKHIDKSQKEYFLKEKLRLIKEELGEISSKDAEVDSLRKKINDLNCPTKTKDKLLSELKRYELLPANSQEQGIIRDYINTLISLPWKTYTKDNTNLNKSRKILDQSHYGLQKIKTRIIEYLAVHQHAKNLKAPIICLVGPPGTGKTSLAKSIAASMERKFVKISVGGVNDEAEIIGHRRTYIGASPGRVINAMKKAKSSNPVFLIDEIDKMTKDYKGDPASTLLEVLDPEQNAFFSDNYVEEEFDLSNVMFIATANYVENIPSPLLDRLEIIELSSYTEYEKLDIAENYLIPKLCAKYNLDVKDIVIDKDMILYIIRHYTKEAGIRELERQVDKIIRKIITDRIKKKNKKKITIKNTDIIEYYLEKPKFLIFNNNAVSRIGVVNGLAYMPYGGDTIPIEVNYYKGKGELILTGSLGEVLKESAIIAFSYIKSNASKLGISYDLLTNNDIHIHMLDGAIPKEGPSAGIALTVALISAFKKIKVPASIALTGEVTLRGEVLPIGGLREKSIGAHRQGIKKIIFPLKSTQELDEVPEEIKKDITFYPVTSMDEVLNIIFPKESYSKVSRTLEKV